MKSNLDKCIDWLRLNRIKGIRVRQGQNICFRTPDEKEGGKSGDTEDVIEFLLSNISTYQTGIYTVLGRTGTGTNSELHFYLKHESDEDTGGKNGNIAGIEGIYDKLRKAENEALERKFDLMIQQIKHENELSKIRAEQEAEKNTQFDLIALAKEYLPMFLKGVPQIPQQVSGSQPMDVTEPNDLQSNLANSMEDLKDFAGGDENFVAMMQKLAAFAKNNPDQARLLLNQ